MRIPAAADRARRWPPLNRALSGTLRGILRTRVPESITLHLPRMGVVPITTPTGEVVRMWSGDDWLTSRIWWRGLHTMEPNSLPLFLRLAQTARTVFDVGGYVGHYALLAAATNPAAHVFAFEPLPAAAARIGANLRLNPGLSVVVVPYVVGERRGPVRFHVTTEGLPSSSSVTPAWEGIHKSVTVGMVDLDSFTSDWEIDDVDLIKMDVEGAEPGVIAGMERILSSSRPVIVTEVHQLGVEGSYEQMSDQLSANDYRFFVLHDDGSATSEPGLARIKKSINHLACPAERIPEWLVVR